MLIDSGFGEEIVWERELEQVADAASIAKCEGYFHAFHAVSLSVRADYVFEVIRAGALSCVVVRVFGRGFQQSWLAFKAIRSG